MALDAEYEDMNKFSYREGPYDDVKYSLQRIYDPLVESVVVNENKGHYIFAVKTNAPEFDLVDHYPSDLWIIQKEVIRLTLDHSGVCAVIMFQKKASSERFAVTLGVHNYAPWAYIATNFGDETPQEIRDSFSGKRDVWAACNGSRYLSKPLMGGRSVDVSFDEEVGKLRYPTEIIVR